jgi:hypothetical protein
MPKRSYVKKAVSTLGSLALTGYLGIMSSACKGSPTTPEPPPTPVTLNFEVYNHIKGYKNNFSKTTMSGDQVIIKVAELGVNDVDQQRIAIKEDGFGRLVRFSNIGEASFYAPKQSMNYDIVLFNAYPGVNYNWMDEKNSKLYQGKHSYTVCRKDYDGQTGPEEPWQEAFDQHNQALILGWIQWGYINRQPNAGSGDFSYGYGYCFGHMGIHQGYRVLIEQSLGGIGPLTIANEEIFENITCVDDIGGGAGSWEKIVAYTTGKLNEVGKHLFADVFAKE